MLGNVLNFILIFTYYTLFFWISQDRLVVFDLGSAVDLRHPNSKEFLKRDINNITRFFKKRGMVVENSDDVFAEIVNELWKINSYS